MNKFTPESFAETHVRRITHEIEAYTKPERLALLDAVLLKTEALYEEIKASQQRETPPVPSSGSGSETSGDTGAASDSSVTGGAEATSAPDEPGAVPPAVPAAGEGGAS